MALIIGTGIVASIGASPSALAETVIAKEKGAATTLKSTNLDDSKVSLFKTRLKETIGIDAVYITQLKGTALFVAFADQGAFIFNDEFTVVMKGDALDPHTGTNVIVATLNEHKDEIKEAVQKKNSIDLFVNGTKKKAADPISHKAELDKSHGDMKEKAIDREIEKKQKILESQTKKYHEFLESKPELKKKIETLSSKRINVSGLDKSGSLRASTSGPVTQKPSVDSVPHQTSADVDESNPSFLTMLVRMNPETRRREGPYVGAGVIPKMADEFFAVYDADPNVPYKGTITVGSDFTCHYCRAFHHMIPTLNKEGVKVRLMPYPRGPVTNFNFSKGYTISSLINSIKVDPLNSLGNKVVSSFCSTDPAKTYTELFHGMGVTSTPTNSKQCEGLVREFKVLGDLFFSNRTPYLIWGDKDTAASEVGYIEGIEARDKNIDDLLRRLQRKS